jgi:HPt (histidine-containing phosphotransfer) domain-containing protein
MIPGVESVSNRPQAAPMTDVPLIDPAALDNLRALGDEVFLQEIIDIFLSDTPKRIDELRRALAARDLRTFARAAHSIKGSASNLGAEPLRALAASLEHDARDTIPADAAARIEALANLLATTRCALGRE